MAENTHTMNNPFEEKVPTAGVQAWALSVRTDLHRYIQPLTIRHDVKPHAEAVEKRLVALENEIGVNHVPEAAARAEFVQWLFQNDWGGGFLFYEESKAAEVKEANRKAAEAAINRIIASAREAAVNLRSGFSGAGVNVGTVVSGLSDLVTGAVHTGTSGGFVRAAQQHPLMLELLQRRSQPEKWPVNACAEVDAMNKYLIAAGHTRLSQIPRGKLYFHAETFNYTSKKWQARAACGNCDQWIDDIGAGRV